MKFVPKSISYISSSCLTESSGGRERDADLGGWEGVGDENGKGMIMK